MYILKKQELTISNSENTPCLVTFVAKTVALNVMDYDQAEKAWMTDIINKVTTSDMTPFEKMDAVKGLSHRARSLQICNGTWKLSGISGCRT